MIKQTREHSQFDTVHSIRNNNHDNSPHPLFRHGPPISLESVEETQKQKKCQLVDACKESSEIPFFVARKLTWTGKWPQIWTRNSPHSLENLYQELTNNHNESNDKTNDNNDRNATRGASFRSTFSTDCWQFPVHMYGEETKERFCKRAALVNVPSFQVSVSRNIWI